MRCTYLFIYLCLYYCKDGDKLERDNLFIFFSSFHDGNFE